MNFLGQMFGETRASAIPGGHPRDPLLASWFGAGSNTLAGVSVTEKSALGVSTVYRAISVLSDSIGWLPLNVYKRTKNDERQKDRSHDLFDILRWQPNPWQTAFEFKKLLMVHFCLRGNAYAQIVGDAQHAITELIPLHPDRVQPFRAPDGTVAYRYQTEQGPQRILLQSEVFHLRGLSWDGLVGLSPIELHRQGIGLAMAMERHGAALFGNNAQPKGGFKIPGTLTDEALKNLRESWETRHKGPDNAGKIALFEGGMEWQQIGLSALDSEYITSREFQAVEVSRMFGVQPHKLFILDRAIKANIEQQSIEFKTDVLEPLMEMWRQAGRRDLLTETGRKTHFIDFNVSALLRGDMVSRFNAYKTGRQWGWLSANDILRKENENGIGEQGDVYLSPMNMTPAQLLEDMVADQLKLSADKAPNAPE